MIERRWTKSSTESGRTTIASPDQYAQHLFSELDGKPLDRELLARFVAQTKGKGQVCDMGCGPGHVACYLHQAGADVFGLDLSPGMIAEAQRLNPEIPFHEGNMLTLDLPDGSLAGIVAFYAIVNLPRDSNPQAFREMARVLQPGGLLLLAHHIGEQTIHRDELWECPISMDFHFHDPRDVRRDLEAAGLAIQEVIEREPYAPEVEHQSRRAYIFARKKMSDSGFGAWSDVTEDGLSYQERLRSEWDDRTK